jgi:two-component system sensor kinase FixL
MEAEAIPDPFTEAVLATSLDAVIIVDDTGLITAWNGNAEKIFGHSARDAVGKPIAELIIPQDQRAGHNAGMFRFLDTGEVRILGTRVKVKALHRDGYEIPIELAVTMHSAIGSRQFISFLRDLTPEMRAEDEIRRLNAEVLQLARLNAMGTAASMIAHELNQPLAAATNYLSVCRRSSNSFSCEAGHTLSHSLSKAQDAIYRASAIVKVIRDIVAARPLRRTKVAVRLLIDDALILLKGSLPVQPVITIEDGAQVALVAKGPTEQVIFNILKNAVEAVGGCTHPKIDCSARREGKFIEICIADNGVGISKDQRRELFSPGSSTKADGLGMGLAICREIIEHHGGKIWCDEKPFRTAFYFTLPPA